MSLSDLSVPSYPQELTQDNLELYLQEDDSLSEWFNTHLALPCFAERLFYNKETKLFEEFVEKLADEVEKNDPKEKALQPQHFSLLGSAISDDSEKQSRIGYYVTVLDKEQGMQFVKQHRLKLFLRSQLHAEWRLSQMLSSAQASFLKDQQWSEEFDQDSGLEEPCLDEEKGRRSTVSFNLRSSEARDEDTDNDDDLYPPRHFRSIEETFDVWRDCYSKQDGRGTSGLMLPRTPGLIRNEAGKGGEKQSLSSGSNVQEIGTPAEEHDSSTNDGTVSARLDSGSTGRCHDHHKCEGDLTSATSFLTERDGEDNSKSVDEAGNNSTKTQTLCEENSGTSQNDVISTKLQPFQESASSLLRSSEETAQDLCENDIDANSSDLRSKNEGRFPGCDGLGMSREGKSQNDAEYMGDLKEATQDSSKRGQFFSEINEVIQNSWGVSNENAEGRRSEQSLSEAQLLASKDSAVRLNEEDRTAASALVENYDEETEETQSWVAGAGPIKTVISASDMTPASTNDLDFEQETVASFCGESRGEVNESILRGVESSLTPSEAVEEADSINSEFYKVKEIPVIHGSGPEAMSSRGLSDTDLSTITTTQSETTESESLDIKRTLQEEEPRTVYSDDESLGTKASDGTEYQGREADETAEVKARRSHWESRSPVEDYESATKHFTKKSFLEVTQLASNTNNGSTNALSKEAGSEEGQETAEFSSEVLDNEGGDDVNEGGDDVNEGGDDVTDTDTHVSSLQGIRGVLSARLSSMNTSVAFDADNESLFTEESESGEQEKLYDLATRRGVDNFKAFLVNTNGEKHVKFWLDVECGKYLQAHEERTRFAQSIRDKFWKSGGILEFPAAFKKRLQMEDASKLSYDNIFSVQAIVLEPLLSYWCPRFTMHHQHKPHEYRSLDYVRMTKLRPRSCVRREQELSDVPQHAPHPGLALHVTSGHNKVRPHSSYVSTQTPKRQLRAKSAHPRLTLTLDTMHTNAGDVQLQNFTAPVRKSYGFEQPKPPSFPADPQPDYFSSVRLYINPVPSPESRMQKMLRNVRRTAVHSERAPETQNPTFSTLGNGVIMDSLIQGLLYEEQSGSFFEAFLYKTGKQLWLNCLSFWKALQQFNASFYADVLNPAGLTKKARYMYANFMVTASPQDIGVSAAIQNQVCKQLEPAYEELFDAVEEHVLGRLLEPWSLCLKQERERSSQVSREQILRHIEIEVVQRRRESIDHAQEFEGDAENMEKEKITIEEANRPMPIPKDGFSFDTLIRNREEVENFKEFLTKKHVKGVKDLMAWTDMETFRRIPRTAEEKRNQKAKDVRGSWLTKKYFFGPDSPATREGQNLIISLNGGPVMKERPSSPVLLESQKFVRARIERRWLLAFKQTAEFIERQKPRSAAAQELVEDLMLKRRLQRSEAAWKILNTKWVSSSRDVVALRQSLLRTDKCAEFKAYLATKGETLESDVLFWLEVQKFKDMCHTHAQESLIRKKVQTIVECFLNSAVAPELQIDIPIEMADKLLEKVTGRSPTIHPYVFREAQMTVFRILYNHWKDYNAYRSRIPEGQSTLEFLTEQLRKHRADIKAKKDASERRRLARLSAERKKKEKEERDKRRIEDLSSLFSMESTSMFNGEEEDTSSWHYSKHMVELERQEHIQRLREQGIVVTEDELTNSDDKQECSKSRRSKQSMAKSSTHSKTDEGKLGLKQSVQDGCSDKRSSEGSVVKSRKKRLSIKQEYADQPTLSSPSARRGSAGSNATRHTSVHSGKGTGSERRSTHVKLEKETPGKARDAQSMAGTCKLTTTPTSRDKESKRKVSEIQVIEVEIGNDKDAIQDLDLKGRSKLLSHRSQLKKRLLSATDQWANTEAQKVPLDAISCISDYSAISNIDYAPRKTASRRGRQGASTPLTSKSLKDFTNSPEGAPLAMPLPLVRITSASYIEPSDGDGSVVDQSPLVFRSRPAQHVGAFSSRTGNRNVQLRRSTEVDKPDVIVN